MVWNLYNTCLRASSWALKSFVIIIHAFSNPNANDTVSAGQQGKQIFQMRGTDAQQGSGLITYTDLSLWQG